MNTDTYVYILGAGASKPDGMPITSEIIDKAFWNFGGKFEGHGFDELMGPWDKKIAINIFKPVFELFDYFYKTHFTEKLETYYKEGYHPHDAEVPTHIIEDFFTRLYRMKYGFDNYGLNLSEEKTSEVVKQASYFFFYTLSYETIDREPKHYCMFIDKALRKDGKHCVISFNYDLLLEDALVSQKYLQLANGKWIYINNLRWTYGINFAATPYTTPYEFPPDKDANFYYLKLHGSLNFGYCPVDKRITAYSLFADAGIYDSFYKELYRCHHGEHIAVPLLIPPLKRKEISIPDLKVLWDKAYDFISQAKELHIIGYSLPEGDDEACALLKASNVAKLEKVVIANPSRDHLYRLRNIFKGCSDRMEVYHGFEEYLKESTVCSNAIKNKEK